jgi:hypothetical protein
VAGRDAPHGSDDVTFSSDNIFNAKDYIEITPIVPANSPDKCDRLIIQLQEGYLKLNAGATPNTKKHVISLVKPLLDLYI